MADALPPPPFERKQKVDRLRGHKAVPFDVSPDNAESEAIKSVLGLKGLRKMRFQGEISPLGKQGWKVTGTLGASITQDCVVSLQPVKTRIDTEVRLRFLPEDMIDPSTAEDVLEEDVEVLGDVIDLGHIAVEALSLATPDYPRAENAMLGQISARPEGTAPILDEETKAFAGLAALKKKRSEN